MENQDSRGLVGTRHPSGRCAGLGVPMAPYALSVLARAPAVRCSHLSPGAPAPGLIADPHSCADLLHTRKKTLTAPLRACVRRRLSQRHGVSLQPHGSDAAPVVCSAHLPPLSATPMLPPVCTPRGVPSAVGMAPQLTSCRPPR